jgi:hypothetical protein
LSDIGRRIQDYFISYKEGYWGKIGAIYSISPQFHAEFSQVEVVGHQQDFFGNFGAASLAHLSFFASTTAAPVHPLRIQPFLRG